MQELIKALTPFVKDLSSSGRPVSAWSVKVFHFKNYDGRMERERIGERFSAFILDALIQLDLAAGGVDATEPNYIPMRSPEPTVDWAEYADFMPFVGIIGFVAPAGDERFHSSIRVAAITGPAQVQTRRVEQIECAYDTPSMLRSAQEVAARIRDEITRMSGQADAAAQPAR